MFWIGITIGLLIGANLSLLLYACVITGKTSDKHLDYIDVEFEECDD